MFSYVEETKEGTVLYQVRTYRWCMCWAFFYASEVFELRKLFKNPCSQAELNKIVPFGFSLQRQKMVFFCHQNRIILLC